MAGRREPPGRGDGPAAALPARSGGRRDPQPAAQVTLAARKSDSPATSETAAWMEDLGTSVGWGAIVGASLLLGALAAALIRLPRKLAASLS